MRRVLISKAWINRPKKNSQPLNADHIQALAAFFGWSLPDSEALVSWFSGLVFLFVRSCMIVFFLTIPSKILSWNVRGLNSARQDSVWDFVDSIRADIVCLQETKMAAVSRQLLLSSLGWDLDNFIELLAEGAWLGAMVLALCDAQENDWWPWLVAYLRLWSARKWQQDPLPSGAKGRSGGLPRSLGCIWRF